MSDTELLTCERGNYDHCEPGHVDPAERIIVAGLDRLIDHKAYQKHYLAAAWVKQMRDAGLLAEPAAAPPATIEVHVFQVDDDQPMKLTLTPSEYLNLLQGLANPSIYPLYRAVARGSEAHIVLRHVTAVQAPEGSRNAAITAAEEC